MKKSLVFILLIFIPVFFLAGCTQLKTSRQHSEFQTVKTNNSNEENYLSSNYYYLESRLHIQNKNFQKAIVSLEKALTQDPGSFILTQDLIWLYLRQNNNDKAFELSEKLVLENPDNVDALLLLVQLKKDSLDEKKLVEILNQVIELDPKNKEIFLRLGKIHMDKENYTEALILFKKMVDQFPDYYVARFYLGQVNMIQKHYDLAKIQFLKTIELEPDLLEPRFQLIEIYNTENIPNENRTDNRQKIIETYKEILEIEPDNNRAQLGMALHYFKNNRKKQAENLFLDLGRDIETNSRLVMVAVDEYLSGQKYEDAVIVFSQMLKADPDNSTLNFFTGMSYEAVGDFKKAISYYLKIKPDHSQYKKTILNIAMLYKRLGEELSARNYLEDKYKLFPKDIDIIIYLASFYEKDNNYDQAIALFKKGLEDSPENTSLLFRLGALQDKAGFAEESMVTMKKIIEIDPKDASALNYLGYSYADRGIKLDEALLLLKRAYELRPDDGYITDSLGWVYYKLGQYQKAVEHLEKAAQLTSFETIISDHLGDAYQKTDQFKKALETYKKALSNAKDEDKNKILELKEKINAARKKIDE
ncbi:tetratricopeptide repeat protein [Desulfobacula toluolica]|uniref:Tetratricopeptide (TRP1+2) repeat protein n=1 Tax=Desulfobacula toluolica (strain DSM 7467 / Tol2) TaxID=651182 RepID=K0N7V8_DESTT|nr:tetratricopeptide repeat protein [Desulfobacula toluolica]CCK80014.1 tetratricopeptide (TRP1+2) repeat protein [Desulfobacula toluolica Tol2]